MERSNVFDFPIRVFGWVTAAVSLVNLSDHLQWVELSITFQKLISGFRSLIYPIFDLLFGWINVPYLVVTEIEANLIVVLSVIGSSFAKAVGLVTVVGANFKIEEDPETKKKSRVIVEWSSEQQVAYDLAKVNLVAPFVLFFVLCVLFLIMPVGSTETDWPYVIIAFTAFPIFAAAITQFMGPDGGSIFSAFLYNMFSIIVIFVFLVAINQFLVGSS